MGDMGTQPLLENECELLYVIESHGVGGGVFSIYQSYFVSTCIDDGLFFIIMI